ncbi:MAG: hypothetical protein QXU47_08885 [Candidatus Bathyarchaeia archaeon]
MDSSTTVKVEVGEDRIYVNIDVRTFQIVFPKNTFEKFPEPAKKILAENLAFASTMHLPFITGINVIRYEMAEPSAKGLIEEGFKLSLPATAFLKSQRTSELFKRFSKFQYFFEDGVSPKYYLHREDLVEAATLLFSFGKDSLLTYALCREIDVEPVLVYVKEPLTTWENYFKEELSKRFFQEFGDEVLFIDNELGALREPDKSLEERGWYGWELQLTQIGLMLLPIAYARKAKYIFFGNEKSCDEGFWDAEGFWCNPVYEQSSEWIFKFREIVKTLGFEKILISSLIEPLHELAVIRILHHRYPEIAKYQMSCGENMPEPRSSRWCGNCSKCARMYIFFLANNIDPGKLGMPTDMLELKYRGLFCLFNGSRGNYGYDSSRLGRDEQLLAFLMAYRNGYEGDLMNLFEKTYLEEAERREQELKKKFFRVYQARTIPGKLKDKIFKIFQEELKDLQN